MSGLETDAIILAATARLHYPPMLFETLDRAYENT